MKYFFLIFFVIIQTSNYEALELNDYIEKINNGYQIIDVRTQSEFAHGHIPNAVNLDFYNHNFIEEINKMMKISRHQASFLKQNKSNKRLK